MYLYKCIRNIVFNSQYITIHVKVNYTLTYIKIHMLHYSTHICIYTNYVYIQIHTTFTYVNKYYTTKYIHTIGSHTYMYIWSVAKNTEN